MYMYIPKVFLLQNKFIKYKSTAWNKFTKYNSTDQNKFIKYNNNA